MHKNRVMHVQNIARFRPRWPAAKAGFEKAWLLLALGIVLTQGQGQAAGAEFETCVASLRANAQAQGTTSATLARTLDSVQFDPEIIPLSTNQPEFKTPIWDYLSGLVDQERVDDGRSMMQRHAQAFATAEQRFSVDRAVIAAVWGVESDFGRGFGTRPVIRSLTTLSCAGPRQSYFRSELLAALKIVQNGDIEPSQFNGSWAGAFGHTQFMPSTFLRTAVDLDGDGRRDLINSVPDALGSTAAYLRKGGWTPGLEWGYEVLLPPHYAGPSGRTRKEPLATWAARGLRRMDGAPLSGATPAGLLLPAGPTGPAFLVTRNFEAIYSYNAAESYALAIALLSNRLRGRPGLVAAWPTDDPGLSRAERREVQALLMRQGYDLDGKADGVIGTKSRQAISDFQQRHGLAPNGRASASVLAALRR
ncbi:lytic murein transglycosylase [Beijerinckia indica]|uniref:Lytic murein transglycosylase n=1 Tax=Beijerinckia indica subsp. indica (strain ATCC 9039 / DSM 1715 / NCIMB 8712) TaxID=395963 RepID=B2IGV1_BEII9|nr:lytic murein transglycosylase [Beijerinckia indica]ACB97197.1 lytic murein transglycosylase [Beijerinckia indica subsp. indica ATCC 9039]